MKFEDIMVSFAAQPDAPLRIPQGWSQGRASFGGLVGALLYQAMAEQCEPDRGLRSMAVSFVGPVAPEQDAHFSGEILRQGKAVSQFEARARQDGQTVAAALASFGAARASAVQVAPEPAPEAPAPDTCKRLPYLKGVTPEFTREIEMRWAFGGLPFSNTPEREMGGWMRFRDASGPMTAAHLVALIDAWPPAVLPHLKQYAPASSLSWIFELMQPLPQLNAGDWLLYRAGIDQASDGYGQTSAAIWSSSGQLLALSRQTVTIFG